MLDFVFLDLDDTLLDFHKAEAEAIRKTLQQVGVEATEDAVLRFSVINDMQWKRLETGELTREQVKLRRFEVFFEELGISASAEKSRLYFEAQIAKTYFFIPGAEQLLKDLTEKGCQLYLGSNGSVSVQQGRIAASGIQPYFQKIFLSEEVGFVKPQKEFFDYCFSQISNFSLERAVILGDSLTSDILGGHRANIRTCWFNRNGKKRNADIVPDHEIQHLSQFPALLD